MSLCQALIFCPNSPSSVKAKPIDVWLEWGSTTGCGDGVDVFGDACNGFIFENWNVGKGEGEVWFVGGGGYGGVARETAYITRIHEANNIGLFIVLSPLHIYQSAIRIAR